MLPRLGKDTPSADSRCSFCDRRGSEERRLIGGETRGVYICAECVTVCQESLDDSRRSPDDAQYQRERRLRRAIVSLQRHNALMQVAFDAIDEGVAIASTDGEILISNASAKRMFGTEPVPEPEWADSYGLFHPDGTTRLAREEVPLVRAMRGERADDIRMMARNKHQPDGIITSVDIRPLRDRGTMTGGMVLVRDITRISHSEAHLQRAGDELHHRTVLMETVLDSIADGVIAADRNGEYLVYNRSATQIIGPGIPGMDLNQRPVRYGLYYPDGETLCPYDELPLTRALRNSESVDDFDLIVRNEHRPDGIRIRVSGRPLRDQAGTISGGVIVFRDVTRQVRTEKALLEAFSEGRLEVLETILHNIGNAINSVATGTGTIREELQDNLPLRRLHALAEAAEVHRDDWISYLQRDPQGQRVLPFIIALARQFSAQTERLQRAVTRVTDRVTHIVDIIRTQRALGSTAPVYKDVDLRQTIMEAVKLLQESLTRRAIELQVECAAVEIRIQESRFHQMIINLIKNAMEAIEDGGVTQPLIRIRARVEGDLLLLDVIDNGIGLEPESLQWIFSPGYTTKTNGSGLGLHSAANYVIGTGGNIRPYSDGVGHGTTIRIQLRLPARQQQEAAHA